MLEVEQTALKRAIQMLTAAKCQFAVVAPDGTKYGDLEIVVHKRRRRTLSILPFGTLTGHVVKFLGELPVNGATTIPPLPDVPIETLRSAATSWATQKWGKGSYISSVTVDRAGIEILRLE